jgi:hypothetical protein
MARLAFLNSRANRLFGQVQDFMAFDPAPTDDPNPTQVR